VIYPYDTTEFAPAELGASIFVTANKNLMRAAKEFNLTLLKIDNGNGEMGIWDGSQFYIKVGALLSLPPG
jgi:prenylcysteine oxidase / farnesylcysteine lyase